MSNARTHRAVHATIILAAAVFAATAGVASAATVTQTPQYMTTTNVNTPGYTVSNDDLLQTSATLTSSTGDFAKESGGGTPILTDGAEGVFSTYFAHPYSATGGPSAGTQLVYTLDTSTNTGGYTITNINTFGGWYDNGRDQQSFTVSYSTVAAPSTFIDIATVNYNPPVTISTEHVYNAVYLSSAEPLADNVARIKFTFNTTENGYSGYREIDVIGVPVPEPTSLSLLALGGMALLRRRRRRAV